LIIINVIGIIVFQVVSIRVSYRIRGNETRTQIKNIMIIIVIIGVMKLMWGIKISTVNKDIIIIELYSAMKIIENFPPLYSVL